MIQLVLPLLAAAATQTAARAFPEGERLFRADPRWLGADAALTIPLDERRTLWLFGDTFVATSDAHRRAESEMVRNTVADQTGMDPRGAAIEFGWKRGADGSPTSFFPERGERWYWPGHGIRLAGGPLLVFLYELAATPGAGLGFAVRGWALARIDAPDESLERWELRVVEGPALPFDALPATAVLEEDERIVALAIRQEGVHAGALVRWPAGALLAGELDTGEWWSGAAWVAADELGPSGPAFVLDDAGAECSLHRDGRSGRWVHVASYGFGATTIGVRTAPAITGPWSAPVTVHRPVESDGPRPFVYAAKAHPELLGPAEGDLLVTYAANSFEFGDLFTPEGERDLYWPLPIPICSHVIDRASSLLANLHTSLDEVDRANLKKHADLLREPCRTAYMESGKADG